MPELIPAEPGTLPEGWSATELAVHNAREALAAWDRTLKAGRADAARHVAKTLRDLLAELDTERRLNHA